MSSLLNVSSSPHIRQSDNTTGIMLDVLISLLPATVFGIVLFGYRAAILIAVCVASCLVFEFLARKLFKNQGSLLDLSAAVTGLLIALNLPPRFPVWMAIIGCMAGCLELHSADNFHRTQRFCCYRAFNNGADYGCRCCFNSSMVRTKHLCHRNQYST